MKREPKQDRSRATRRRLLEATIDCLAELGWGATTVGVVAERAGVSRGATQHHFPTREDLITAAINAAGNRVREVSKEKMSSVMGGMGGMPGMPGLF